MRTWNISGQNCASLEYGNCSLRDFLKCFIHVKSQYQEITCRVHVLPIEEFPSLRLPLEECDKVIYFPVK